MAQFAVRYSFGMLDTNGRPMPNAPYEIFLTGTTTPADVWASRLKNIAILSPISNEKGNAIGWLDPDDNYDIVFGGNTPQPLPTLPRDKADAGAQRPLNGWTLNDFSVETVQAIEQGGDQISTEAIDPTTGDLILNFIDVRWGIDNLGIYLVTADSTEHIPDNEAGLRVGSAVYKLQDWS